MILATLVSWIIAFCILVGLFVLLGILIALFNDYGNIAMILFFVLLGVVLIAVGAAFAFLLSGEELSTKPIDWIRSVFF